MTNKYKRRVRARMKKTGESYQAICNALNAQPPKQGTGEVRPDDQVRLAHELCEMPNGSKEDGLGPNQAAEIDKYSAPTLKFAAKIDKYSVPALAEGQSSGGVRLLDLAARSGDADEDE